MFWKTCFTVIMFFCIGFFKKKLFVILKKIESYHILMNFNTKKLYILKNKFSKTTFSVTQASLNVLIIGWWHIILLKEKHFVQSRVTPCFVMNHSIVMVRGKAMQQNSCSRLLPNLIDVRFTLICSMLYHLKPPIFMKRSVRNNEN